MTPAVHILSNGLNGYSMFANIKGAQSVFFISYFKSSFIKINIGSRTTFIRALEVAKFEGLKLIITLQKTRHNLNLIENSFRLGH